jgi:hypothetical protein
LIAVVGLTHEATGSDSSDCANIHERIARIETESLTNSRVNLALDLEGYVKLHLACSRYRDVIDDISSLLNDDSEGVRFAAAQALGDIGPNAQRAVPALIRVMKRSDAINEADPSTILPVTDSGRAARDAMHRITGRNIPDYSEVPKRGPVPISHCVIGEPCAVWAKLNATNHIGSVRDETGCIAVALPNDVTDALNAHFVGVAGVVYKIPDHPGLITYKLKGRVVDVEACQSGLVMFVDTIEEVPETYRQ